VIAAKTKSFRISDAMRTMTLLLAIGIMVAAPPWSRGQQASTDTWLGKRVVQRFNNFPLREGGQAVLRSGTEIHIYRVQRVQGEKLWLEGEEDGPSGWATADQFVHVDDAFAYFSDRIRTHPDDPFFYKARAALTSDRKEYGGALGDWNKVVELEPEDPSSYFGRGNIRLTRREWDKAAGDFTQTIKLDPEHADAHRARAFAWIAQHSFDQSIADCNEAIRLDPEDARAFVIRGRAWLGKQEFDKAIVDCAEAVRLDRSDPRAYTCRALAWGRKKEYDKAIADYNTAIKLDPMDAESYFNRAWAWQQKGDNARALADYTVGVRLDPDAARPRVEPPTKPAAAVDARKTVEEFLRTLPLEQAGADAVSNDEAHQQKDEGLIPASFDPIPAPASAGQHLTAQAHGVTPPIRGDAGAALSRDTFGIVEPQTALEYVTRGGDWLRIKLYDKAIADCTEAINLGCHDPKARIFRALAWSEKKEYDKAIADYTEAIKLDPQNAFAYAARATAWSAKQDYGRADADLNKALLLDPENPLQCNGRAWIWATCPDAKYRDGQQGVKAATKACELTNWQEAGIIDTLAAAFAEMGDFGSAQKWQTKAIELESDGENKEEFMTRLKLYQQKQPYRDIKP
jgi:tetratricopeptide (TPR) repeat protein